MLLGSGNAALIAVALYGNLSEANLAMAFAALWIIGISTAGYVWNKEMEEGLYDRK